jgi:hypothetical protein
MPQLISRCGLVCSECPSFIARKTNDDALRQKTAAEWSSQYHAQFTPEQINCDGCVTDNGVLFPYCSVCEIRACAHGRGLTSCAQCADYACETLTKFLTHVPAARETLDRIRAST